MTVKIGGKFSDRHHCCSGVPQGGALSPLLFLIYTMDLPSVILEGSKNIGLQLYADDIKIYGSYNDENFIEVTEELSRCIGKLVTWASKWDLTVNLDKCFVMHIGVGARNQYTINGVTLKSCDVSRDLGVMIDNKLDFSEHINEVVRKAFTSLFSIFRNIHSNNGQILTRLYKSYVLPHLEYCSQAWNPFSKKQILKLEKVQKTFTRLVFYRTHPGSNSSTMPSYVVRMRELGLKSLQHRRIIADLVFVFRILRGEIKMKPSKYWTFIPSSERTGGFNLHYRRILRPNHTRMFMYFSIELQDGCSVFHLRL